MTNHMINRGKAFFSICWIVSLVCLSSCSPQTTSIFRYSNYYYTPNNLKNEIIETPVYIEVILEDISLDLGEYIIISELNHNIKQSFINELRTVFPNVVKNFEESEIKISVKVNRLITEYSISFMNYLPFIRVVYFLLGGPVFSTTGLADVGVYFYNSECNSLIAHYESLSKVSGYSGFYYGMEHMYPWNDEYVVYLASGRTMNNIKSKIVGERSLFLNF